MLIIVTFFTALLVPIAVALFLFSDPPLRKKPVFICNVLAALLGLAYGGVGIYSAASVQLRLHACPDISNAACFGSHWQSQDGLKPPSCQVY